MKEETLLESLHKRGVSRRTFLKFCTVTASSLALPKHLSEAFADSLAAAPRPAVIWISTQECTGCSESLLRSFEPTVETLILDHFSLNYHNTLQAAAGTAAEASKGQTIRGDFGRYIAVVDGSVPIGEGGSWSMIGGRSALDVVYEAVERAALVISVGNCASFGGLPKADPNPGDSFGVDELMAQQLVPRRPLINIPGCPPVPEVLTGSIAYVLAFRALPELDQYRRPKVYFGKTVHDCCNRLTHYVEGNFALSFDDEGARNGWCLWQLGCKGPTTYNACSTVRWNQGTSYPMHSGHGCLGCSEPGFWDKAGFYEMTFEAPAPGDGSTCTAPPQTPLS
ncbi:MAG: hydrogenase small subunit [Pseudomonadota bacterium]|nr:hydrogenase small subunit [Pseudomonadota bacterium]